MLMDVLIPALSWKSTESRPSSYGRRSGGWDRCSIRKSGCILYHFFASGDCEIARTSLLARSKMVASALFQYVVCMGATSTPTTAGVSSPGGEVKPWEGSSTINEDGLR